MEKQQLNDKVLEIVREHLVDDKVELNSKLDDTDCDSLDQVELAMTMEEDFDVNLTDEDLRKIVTVGDYATLIKRMKDAEAH